MDVTLESDREKPDGERPTFRARYMTAREHARYMALIAEVAEAADDEQRLKLLVEAIAIALVGWKHLPVKDQKFDLQRLPDLLTRGELIELVEEILRKTELGSADRKKSDSPSPSLGDSAADAAAAASV